VLPSVRGEVRDPSHRESTFRPIAWVRPTSPLGALIMKITMSAP